MGCGGAGELRNGGAQSVATTRHRHGHHHHHHHCSPLCSRQPRWPRGPSRTTMMVPGVASAWVRTGQYALAVKLAKVAASAGQQHQQAQARWGTSSHESDSPKWPGAAAYCLMSTVPCPAAAYCTEGQGTGAGLPRLPRRARNTNTLRDSATHCPRDCEGIGTRPGSTRVRPQRRGPKMPHPSPTAMARDACACMQGGGAFSRPPAGPGRGPFPQPLRAHTHGQLLCGPGAP